MAIAEKLQAAEATAPAENAAASLQGAAAQTAMLPAEGEILLKERYRLLWDAALSAYDAPTAKAYAVKDTLYPDRKLFAHVCFSGLPLHGLFLEQQREKNIRGVLHLVEEAVVTWPSIARECPVLIYMQPGPPLSFSPDAPMKAKAIERTIIAPVVETLRALEALGLTHRGIRPDNFFLVEDKEGAETLLGDCLSAPSAYNQPLVFEPIESALAAPAGRGRGSIADDLYSLGVTVLALFFGELPAKDIDQEAILKGKIQKGSYDFLTNKQTSEFPLRMMELLKGLLHDDGEKRWGLEHLERWLEEYRKLDLPSVPKLEQHIFTFRKEQYVAGRALAIAFLQYPQEATKSIREGRFEAWVGRSLANPDIVQVVTDEIAKSRVTPILPEQLVARIAILLDPDAPIRYKDFAAKVDGFGTLLASCYADDVARGNFSEIIRLQLPQLWLAIQAPEIAKNRKILQRLNRVQHFLNRRGLGFGIERCLYELVPGLPCQSPLVLSRYCASIPQLLSALEEKAGEMEKLVEPIDSHLAAFIVSNFQGKVDEFLFSLSSPAGSVDRALGILGLMASLQNRYGPEGLVKFTNWVWKLLPPVIASYHNQALRARLLKEVEGVLSKGSLVAIYNLIGNPAQRRADQRGYAMARNQFMRALGETAKINRKLQGLPLASRVLGNLFAVRLSALIALIAVGMMTSEYM